VNRISSKDYFMECRRASRPDLLKFPRYVQENRIDLSTICVAVIESRRPRTTNALSLFIATQVPPSHRFCLPRELGKLRIDVCKRSGIGEGPMNRKLPKQLERGVWYEA